MDEGQDDFNERVRTASLDDLKIYRSIMRVLCMICNAIGVAGILLMLFYPLLVVLLLGIAIVLYAAAVAATASEKRDFIEFMIQKKEDE